MNRFCKKVLILTVSSLVLATGAAQAHHSFSATFTADRKETIQGSVTKFNFRNPHVLLYVDVTDDNGKVMSWVSEGNSATLLRRSGWDASSFVKGDIVRITGDATHDGSPMTSIDFVEVLDPQTLEVVDTKIRNNKLELYKPATAENVPLTLPDGRPNLNGVWEIQYRGEGPPAVPAVPLNAAGLKVQAASSLANDPQVFCDPPGLARQAVTHHPTRFKLYEDHVLVTYEEFAGLRKIYFDDRAALGVPTHLGDSIARYDGNKLVIETTNLLSNLTTTKGMRLSDKATMIETYHRVDADHDRTALGLKIVVSDPVYLAEDFVVNKVLWDAGTDYEMLENDCHAPLRHRETVSPAVNVFVLSAGVMDIADDPNVQCREHAATIGQGNKGWRALLGNKPETEGLQSSAWYNAKGEFLGKNLSEVFPKDNKWATDEHGRGIILCVAPN